MDKKISLAKKMPGTLALLPVIFIASYILTALETESAIGNPSSTHAIGYFFVIIYSFIAAIIGYVVGLIAKHFLLKRGERDLVNKTIFFRNTAIIAVLLGGFSGGSAYQEVVDYVEFNAPHVISNSAVLEKVNYTEEDVPSVTSSAEVLWEYDNQDYPAFNWNKDQLKFKVYSSVYMYVATETKHRSYYNFSGRTYLTEIKALPTSNYLVVLARLRATSARSMLLIYDKEYNLVYEELLDRCGRKQYIGTTSDIDGEVLVVNICKPFVLNINKNT